MKSIAIFVSLLIHCFFSGSVLARNSFSPELSLNSSFRVPQEQWLQELQVTVKEEVCNSSSYYMTCFEIEKNECKEFVREKLRSCARSKRIPASLDASDGGSYYAKKVGVCLIDEIGKNWHMHSPIQLKCKERGTWK